MTWETLMVGGLLILVFMFFVYQRYNGRLQEMVEQKRETLLHTEESFLKRQQDYGLDFIHTTNAFAVPTAHKLEAAFPLSYQVNVYNRLVKETTFSEERIMQLMFEQKRFLLMASVLKSVPMFSKEVDEVWHQMLMFTREYQAFSQRFAGHYIHHAPNVEETDERDARFNFEMMYLQFFTPMPFTEEMWGARFYSTPASTELLELFERLSEHELRMHYFFDTIHAQSVSYLVAQDIKASIRKAKNYREHDGFSRIRKQTEAGFNQKGHARDTSSSSDHLFTLPYILWVSDQPTHRDSGGHMNHGASKNSTDTQSNDGFFCGGSGGSGSSGGGSGSSCGSSCGSGCGSS